MPNLEITILFGSIFSLLETNDFSCLPKILQKRSGHSNEFLDGYVGFRDR